MKLSKTQWAIIALIIANIIWGAASPIFKWSLENIQPFTLAYLRFLLGAVVLLPFCRNLFQIERHDIGKLFLLTITGITLAIGTYFLGIQRTTSINVPIINSCAPMFLVLFAWIFLRERPKSKMMIGLVTALLGILIIIFQPLLQKGLDGNVFGNILILVSTLIGIVGTVVTKEIIKKYDPIVLTFWSFLIATVSFLPLFLYEALYHASMQSLTLQGFTGIFYGGLFSSALAYILFNFALKNVSASETGLFTYIDPLAAVVIAIPLLGEIPQPLYILGTIFVFAGIYIAEGRIPYHPFHKLKNAA